MSTPLSEILASTSLICDRLQLALAPESLLLLNRSQWRCLANSYRSVLRLLEHACSSLALAETKSMCGKLLQPLRALHMAVQEGVTCMQESLPSGCSSTNSWLVEKALTQGMSSDIVDVHLHHFLWTLSVVCVQISWSAPCVRMEGFMLQLTKELSAVWSCVNNEEDLRVAQSLLSKIQGEEEGESGQLAYFVLQRLTCSQSLTRRTDGDDLPSFMWVDSHGFQRDSDVVGEGGYGKVYKARWLGGHFAVKDFLYVENDVVFGREAAIQAQLCHPNVMPLVCCTRNPSSSKCSLVMELMQLDLRMLMIQRVKAKKDPPFSLLVAVDLMLQIARGMEYLHSLRIMHRDLKSSNILVNFLSKAGVCSSHLDNESPFVHLKVADFGMAKAKYVSSTFSTRQTGTTLWRAPEVFAANLEDEVCLHPNAKYTNKADVYSFALVCYEILTGKLPFEGTQIRRRVLAGERPMLPTYCSPALSSYIQVCWHAEPTQRPTFTQICRMLRYFKACMFLQGHLDCSPAHLDWLLHPVSYTMCADIDYLLQSRMQQFDSNLPPQPVIIIPLESMFCCREISQKRENNEANGRFSKGKSTSHALTNDSTAMSASHSSEHHAIVVSRAESRRGFLKRTIQLVKRLPILRSKPQSADDSEFRNAFSLMGAFSYADLNAATKNFSSFSEIGRGGSGQVYCGTLVDGRRIAVKRAGSFRYAASTLSQELRIGSQLRHRNIVPLLGWCQNQGELLLVYEYMPNGDLAKHIHGLGGRVVEWELRCRIVCQLAAALKYLHEDSGYKQIVHRDVKTNNIMLDSEWNARLGDCGIALLLEGDSCTYPIQGTLGFLAPEAMLLSSVSLATDIFAFGVTVFEIVTRRRAYEVISSGSKRMLFQWVRDLYEQGELMQAADSRLGGCFDAVEMERLLLLGLACTNFDPEARPDINEVLRILSGRPLQTPIYRWPSQSRETSNSINSDRFDTVA